MNCISSPFTRELGYMFGSGNQPLVKFSLPLFDSPRANSKGIDIDARDGSDKLMSHQDLLNSEKV